jgi:hypothetical protein
MTGITCTADPAARMGALQMPVMAEGRRFAADLDALRQQEQEHGLGGCEETASEMGHRDRVRSDEAGRFLYGRPIEQAERPDIPEAGGIPVFRLVIGVDNDPRAWVRVANALLDRIASGAVRAGSPVPPVSRLGVEPPVPPGTAARAFRMLADEGVLRWVPGRGYYVRTRFTVPVSDRPRPDGRLTAVLPGGERGQHAGRGVPVSNGPGRQ